MAAGLALRSAPPADFSGTTGAQPQGARVGHFRACDRRAVRLAVEVTCARWAAERPALIVDLGLGGARLETDDPLVTGDRISLAIATPATWDPLVVEAVVAWTAPAEHEPATAHDRPGAGTQAGVAFQYASPISVLTMAKTLATLDQ